MQKLIFEGEGHANHSSVPGDVIVTIKFRDSPDWRRLGNNLVYNMMITFEEAMLGFNREISEDVEYIVIGRFDRWVGF